MSIPLNREEAKAGSGFSRREENFSKKYEKGGESQCEERKNEDETKPSLLLHSCCGPQYGGDRTVGGPIPLEGLFLQSEHYRIRGNTSAV